MSILSRVMCIGSLFLMTSCCEPPKASSDFNGSFHSPEWGAISLTQSGHRVLGTYDHDSGQLAGVVAGGRVNFRWWEKTPVGKPYESALPSERGDGYFDLVDRGNQLSGKWRYEGESDFNRDWTARRK